MANKINWRALALTSAIVVFTLVRSLMSAAFAGLPLWRLALLIGICIFIIWLCGVSPFGNWFEGLIKKAEDDLKKPHNKK